MTPYSSLTIGVPCESWTSESERQVAITPQNVALLKKKGFLHILVESGAGELAQFSNVDYEKAGAEVVTSKTGLLSSSDIVLKVQPLSFKETEGL